MEKIKHQHTYKSSLFCVNPPNVTLHQHHTGWTSPGDPAPCFDITDFMACNLV